MHILHLFLVRLISTSHAQSGTSGGSAGTSGGSAGTSGGSGGFNLVNPLGDGMTLTGLIGKLLLFFQYAATLIVPFIVLYAAFQMMTAADNPEKFESGKKTLLYAVIGFGIILIAQGVVAVIQEVLGV